MRDEGPVEIGRDVRPTGEVTARKIEDLDAAEARLIDQIREQMARQAARKGKRSWFWPKRGR